MCRVNQFPDYRMMILHGFCHLLCNVGLVLFELPAAKLAFKPTLKVPTGRIGPWVVP